MPASTPAESPRVRAATPTDVSAAIAARRRREYVRHLRVVGGGLATATLLGGLVWAVGYSPLLASSQVDVQGNHLLTNGQLLATADVPMGVPLARLDTGPVATRLSQLPAVEQVDVSTRWPGTVVVRVVERTAIFQRRQGSAWQQVDAHGVVFKSDPKPAPGLLEVSTPRIDNALLADAATVVAALPPGLRSQTRLVEAPGPDQMALVLKSGQRVIWGGAADSSTKAQVAQALMGQKKFTILNVSSPANPTAR